MPDAPLFEHASPFQDDMLALPVTDLDEAAQWYAQAFGMTEVERRAAPQPTVILERDGTQIGFAINGGDATQDVVRKTLLLCERLCYTLLRCVPKRERHISYCEINLHILLI